MTPTATPRQSHETETSGVLLDADELERRLEAVAALADALKDATGGASQAEIRRVIYDP